MCCIAEKRPSPLNFPPLNKREAHFGYPTSNFSNYFYQKTVWVSIPVSYFSFLRVSYHKPDYYGRQFNFAHVTSQPILLMLSVPSQIFAHHNVPTSGAHPYSVLDSSDNVRAEYKINTKYFDGYENQMCPSIINNASLSSQPLTVDAKTVCDTV